MTITATGNRESYAGNGVTTTFAFPHPFFVNTDLAIFEQIVSTGAVTTLVLITDYTVSGAGTQTGGQVTRTTATAIGTNIVIVRAVPYTQGASFPNNTAFDGPTVEAAFDRSVVLNAQVLDAVSRTMQQPATDVANIGPLPGKVTRASTYMAFDSNGDPIAAAGPTSGGAPVSVYGATLVAAANAAAAQAVLQVYSTAQIDATNATKANIASPTFTGTPSAPTPALNDSSTKLATTAFVGASFPYYIAGLQIVNNGTTSMDIQAGVATDGNNTHTLVNASTFTKTQAAFAAGTGNGGKMSAAAMANNTWYYFYQLRKDSDGTGDFGFDVSPTAPTAQAGYTAANYRYIGARKTQSGSTSWDTFIQHGDEVLWSTPPALDVNATGTTANRTLSTVNVPAVKVKWRGNFALASGASGVQTIGFTDPACADVAPSQIATPLANLFFNGAASTNLGSQAECWTNTSSQIGIRVSQATNSIAVGTLGWRDPRGVPV